MEGRELDVGDIEVGDMVIVALVATATMSRPFAIGRVLDRRSNKTLLIHWYGNELRQLEGTYRPEWQVPVGKG